MLVWELVQSWFWKLVQSWFGSWFRADLGIGSKNCFKVGLGIDLKLFREMVQSWLGY
jgi:hypothetical protein